VFRRFFWRSDRLVSSRSFPSFAHLTQSFDDVGGFLPAGRLRLAKERTAVPTIVDRLSRTQRRGAMSLLDGILGQAGEGVTVQNLAKRVGLTPDEAGSAVSALGQAHVQDGDTVQTASEATGLPGDKLNEIVHNIQEVKTLSGALPRWLRARVDWPAFWEGCPSFSSSQKPGSFIQGGVSDGFTSQSSSRSSVHRVRRGSHVPGNRRSPSPL
jgi:hypothetical protein